MELDHFLFIFDKSCYNIKNMLTTSDILLKYIYFFFWCSKVTVSLRYADLVSVLPSRIRVLAWPIHPSKKALITDKKGSGATVAESIPSRLSYAEDALRTMSLPEGSPSSFFALISKQQAFHLYDRTLIFVFFFFSIRRNCAEFASSAWANLFTYRVSVEFDLKNQCYQEEWCEIRISFASVNFSMRF